MTALPTRGLSLAHELLLQAVCVTLGTHDVARLQAFVAQPVDWSEVIQCGYDHDVLPLVYEGLRRAVPDALPSEIAAQLKATYTANVWRTVMLSGELLSLLGILADAGLAAFPFKGPVLGSMLYDDPALRVSSDLDILIAPQDYAQAADLLAARGYRPQNPGRYTHHGRFEHPNRQVVVELHYRLLPREWPGWDMAALHTRLAPIALGGQTVYSLPPRDLLHYLVLHGHRHQWARLKWVVDLALMHRVYPMSAWCVPGEAYLPTRQLALWLVHTLLKMPWPDEVPAADMVPHAPQLAETLVHTFFEPREQLSPHAQALFERMAHAGLRAQLAARFRVWFTPRSWDRAMITLPRSLAPLYYPLRIGRLMLTRPRLVLSGVGRLLRLLWTEWRVRVNGWLKPRA